MNLNTLFQMKKINRHNKYPLYNQLAKFILTGLALLTLSSCSHFSSSSTPAGTKSSSSQYTTSIPQNIYYVDGLLGSDSNPGSKTEPWKTIEKAANTITSGDAVIVMGGTYPERVQVTRSGSPGASITFQAEGVVITNGFTIKADYIIVRGFEVTDTPDSFEDGVGIYVQGRYCILENNYIHYATRGGIMLYDSSNCVVLNNRLYRNSQYGIRLHGQSHLVEGNEIWGTIQYHPKWINPPSSTVDADGIRFFGSAHTIKRNYIHDISYNDPENIDPHIDCFQTWDGPDFEAGHDIIFEQNICVNLEANGFYETGKGFMLSDAKNLVIVNNLIRSYFGIFSDNSSNLTIVNNTFAYDLRLARSDDWTSGVVFYTTPGSVITNNIFYDFNNLNINIQDSSSRNGLTIGSNLAFRSDGANLDDTSSSENLWNINPEFVDPHMGDFHLRPESPAINTGETINIVTNDLDGVSRPQGDGYDIGAYEYSESR